VDDGGFKAVLTAAVGPSSASHNPNPPTLSPFCVTFPCQQSDSDIDNAVNERE
jgi:hypothetical protein